MPAFGPGGMNAEQMYAHMNMQQYAMQQQQQQQQQMLHFYAMQQQPQPEPHRHQHHHHHRPRPGPAPFYHANPLPILHDAFRTLQRGKPWFDNWEDPSSGTYWASCALPQRAHAQLVRALQRHLSSGNPMFALPPRWSAHIDPGTGVPFYTLASARGNHTIVQQWEHPATQPAVGCHTKHAKAARWDAALAACFLLDQVGLLGGGGRGAASAHDAKADRSKQPPHPASPSALRRLADDGEWYVLLAGKASVKGLRKSLTTCFASYRWGKLSQHVRHRRQKGDQGRHGGGQRNRYHKHGKKSAHHLCHISLPADVTDELPEMDALPADARYIVGEGPTKELAEGAALLASCRALARLGLLVQGGAGTGGQDGVGAGAGGPRAAADASPMTSPFVVLFPETHTKGFKGACTSNHVLPPAPGATVTLSEETRAAVSSAVSQFETWMPLGPRASIPTTMPPCLPGCEPFRRAVLREAGPAGAAGAAGPAGAAGVAGEQSGADSDDGDDGVDFDVARDGVDDDSVGGRGGRKDRGGDLDQLVKRLDGITPIGLREIIAAPAAEDPGAAVGGSSGGEEERHVANTPLPPPSAAPAKPSWPTLAARRALAEEARRKKSSRIQPFQNPDGTVVYLDMVAEQVRAPVVVGPFAFLFFP